MCTFKYFTIQERDFYFLHKLEFHEKIKELRKEIKNRYNRTLSKIIKCMLEHD